MSNNKKAYTKLSKTPQLYLFTQLKSISLTFISPVEVYIVVCICANDVCGKKETLPDIHNTIDFIKAGKNTAKASPGLVTHVPGWCVNRVAGKGVSEADPANNQKGGSVDAV